MLLSFIDHPNQRSLLISIAKEEVSISIENQALALPMSCLEHPGKCLLFIFQAPGRMKSPPWERVLEILNAAIPGQSEIVLFEFSPEETARFLCGTIINTQSIHFPDTEIYLCCGGADTELMQSLREENLIGTDFIPKIVRPFYVPLLRSFS